MTAKKKKGPQTHKPAPWRIDGKRLREARLAMDWRQLDLTILTGVATSTISRLEDGKQDNTSVETLGAFCEALDLSADWLCGKSSRKSRAG